MSVGIVAHHGIIDNVLEYVLAASQMAEVAVVSLRGIQDFVAKHALEESCEAPVLVIERVVPAVDNLRLSAAHLRLVVISGV